MLEISPARHTPCVRRAVATLFIVVGLVVGAVTLTGWWLRRTAFVTSRTERIASSILGDPVLRDDLARRISTQVAPQLGTDAVTVRQVVDATLARPEVAGVFASVLGDIHARLIGMRSGPVLIGPELLTAALGDARAQALPAVSIQVPKIDQLDSARRFLDRYVARGALIALVLLVLGLALHPWRAAAVGMIGIGLLATAVLIVSVGYLLPVRAVPALSDEPWLAVVPDVARDQQPVLVAVTVLLVGAALACLFGAGLLARRRPQAAYQGFSS
jgi:hypothetical protein